MQPSERPGLTGRAREQATVARREEVACARSKSWRLPSEGVTGRSGFLPPRAKRERAEESLPWLERSCSWSPSLPMSPQYFEPQQRCSWHYQRFESSTRIESPLFPRHREPRQPTHHSSPNRNPRAVHVGPRHRAPEHGKAHHHERRVRPHSALAPPPTKVRALSENPDRLGTTNQPYRG